MTTNTSQRDGDASREILATLMQITPVTGGIRPA